MAATPVLLSAAGFGAAGVTAGSFAAWIQGPAVASGSWFAASQSAGVLGVSAATNTLVGTAGGATAFGADVLRKKIFKGPKVLM